MEIGIADPQGRVRFSLRVLLEQQGWTVDGESADCQELLDLLSKHAPDLLLVDMDLPGLSFADFIRLTRVQYPQMKIVALSGRQECGRPAMAAGADAFVCKAEPPEKLLNLICELQDHSGISPSGGGG